MMNNVGSGEAANAAYVFGDSFVDTANAGNEFAPYGMTWPGYPSGRASDGRNQADYFGKHTHTHVNNLFHNPTFFKFLKQEIVNKKLF